MIEAIPIDEVERHFAAFVDRVIDTGQPLLLTREGKPVAELRPVGRGRPLRELAGIFAALPRLGRAEAEAFTRDIEEARAAAERVPVHDPWSETE